ncbi:hypothetical protein [Bradyrhizobium sp. AS23.2]|uniref:hypothetical protein n=1 Tax=Bradyrhizobium sp. AS23.2 TaxID=1680155 RepID=UPI00093B1A08|nr:hypothetical protein [Bradyrhizobium sp. AS23.2]OKO74905.1 hypothetical protein AC630_26005 [Bradyrhizobium sp. AS23.2]
MVVTTQIAGVKDDIPKRLRAGTKALASATVLGTGTLGCSQQDDPGGKRCDEAGQSNKAL